MHACFEIDPLCRITDLQIAYQGSFDPNLGNRLSQELHGNHRILENKMTDGSMVHCIDA